MKQLQVAKRFYIVFTLTIYVGCSNSDGSQQDPEQSKKGNAVSQILTKGGSKFCGITAEGEVWINGDKKGSIESNGDIWVAGNKEGSLERNGEVWKAGNKIGEITSDLEVWFEGNNIGEIEKDGEIWHNGESVGTTKGGDPKHAAIIFFFAFFAE